MSSVSTLRRAVVPVAAAAAVAAGGVAFAASASAATAPSLTLNAPAQVLNNGNFASDPLTIRVNNTASGVGALAGSLTLTVSGVSGLACSNITLAPEGTGPTSVGSATSPTLAPTYAPGATGTCTFASTPFTQAANTDVTYNYALGVNGAPLTGTLTSQATVTGTVNGNVVAVATSNSDTTALVAPSTPVASAPTFTTASVPAAIVYQPYSFQLATSAGSPAANYSAFCAPATPNSDGTYNNPYTVSATSSVYNPTTHTDDAAIYLNDGFYFDVVTGKIVNSGPNGTDPHPDCLWTIIANNGTGGATTASSGVGGGSQTQPTPDVAVHDVLSQRFTLPVLFSDVAVNSPFADDIYTLADWNYINGYLDGTYRPSQSVTRQAFAAILGRLLHTSTGPCNPIFDPSPFPDVANGNPFCRQIQDLNNDGIINGYSDGKFHPTASITRQAISAMFYRAQSFYSDNNANPGDATCTTPVPFNDVSAQNPFCGDIEWMLNNQLASGYADGGFHPTATTTRRAVAAFFYRFYEKYIA